MKIHNTLVPGFQEVIYQRCLAIELEKVALQASTEFTELAELTELLSSLCEGSKILKFCQSCKY